MILIIGVLLGAIGAMWLWLSRAQRQLETLGQRVAQLERDQRDLLAQNASRTVDATWRS